MDVTVNIRGNAQGLRDELENVTPDQPTTPTPTPGRTPDDSRPPTLPPSDRLIDDLRRAVMQQGAVMVPGSANYRQILGQVGQNQRTAIDDDISSRYGARRADAQSRMSAEYEKIDKEIEARRQEGLRNLGPNANDPFYQAMLNQQLESERDRRYRKAGTMFDAEMDEIDNQEAQERTAAEKELTEAIRRLTGEMEQRDKESETGGDPNSYINKLREQRRQLLIDRDNAPDEESAMAAQGRLNAVDDQLRRVMNGGGAKQGFGAKMPGLVMGAIGVGSSLSEGDLGGAMISGGSMGLMMGANPYVMAAIIAGGGLWKGATGISRGYDDLGQIAAYRATAGGMRGEAGMGYLAQNIGSQTANGLNPASLNLSMDEFYEQAARRIKARGTTDDWFKETMSQLSLERTLALDQGSLEKGSQYDRYGTNVTDAISRLVTVLQGIEGSGVSSGDFTRVQEKFDIQQQLMASYMGRTDRPDYTWANNTLAAFSATGVQQDSRVGTDIAAFQNMIQNPMNERMRALIYGTVADLMPETGGRMDLIDRAIRDPENEGKIMQAVVQRIQQQFGGTDTTMGYFAFKSLLPNIAPDRLDEYIEQFTGGNYAGGLLKSMAGFGNQGRLDEIGTNNKSAWSSEAAELTSAMTKGITDILNTMKNTGVKVFFGSGVTPNSTKQGQ